MNERLGVLLSAERDGVLEPREAEELAGLRGAGEAARRQVDARAEAFADVDTRLRRLASEHVDDERIARSLAALRQRLAEGRVGGHAEGRMGSRVGSSAGPDVVRGVFGRRLFAGLAAALAAGLVWASVDALRAGSARAPSGAFDAGGSGEPVDAGEAADLAALGEVDADDLEIVEELELLEYLVARDERARAPRG